MREEYTESYCRAKLEKLGCKFGGMNTFTVAKGRIGIKALGMVDYLVKHCKMIAQYV